MALSHRLSKSGSPNRGGLEISVERGAKGRLGLLGGQNANGRLLGILGPVVPASGWGAGFGSFSHKTRRESWDSSSSGTSTTSVSRGSSASSSGTSTTSPAAERAATDAGWGCDRDAGWGCDDGDAGWGESGRVVATDAGESGRVVATDAGWGESGLVVATDSGWWGESGLVVRASGCGRHAGWWGE